MAHTGATAARRAKVGKKTHGGRLVFLREFLKRPAQLGTCFTSSKAFSRKMVEGVGVERASAIVELGRTP